MLPKCNSDAISEIPYRITGLRVMKCEDKYPYFKDYPTHLRIHYKTTYYHLDSWQKYMENGAQKVSYEDTCCLVRVKAM